LTPQHHLVFTFFHVDLQMKLEAPKPVCSMLLISMDYA
jgi:dedicator of cytokinesis protein 6/7/8